MSQVNRVPTCLACLSCRAIHPVEGMVIARDDSAEEIAVITHDQGRVDQVFAPARTGRGEMVYLFKFIGVRRV